MRPLRALAVLASVALHGVAFGVSAPLVDFVAPEPVVVEPEEAPEAPLEAPVRVSFVDPVGSPGQVALPDLVAGAASGPPISFGTPAPAPPRPRVRKVAKAPPPPPEPIPSPPEPAPEAESDVALVDAAEPAAQGEDTAAEARRPRGARPIHRARKARQKEPPPPCDVSPDILALADGTYFVERSLVEYYATHRDEISRLGTVTLHRDASKRPDGFRVGLPRCSLLRQGGLRTDDIVQDINGRRIHTVLQAVAAYIVLRKEPVLYVRVAREGEPESLVLAYHLDERPAGVEREDLKEKGRARVRGRD